MAEIEPRQAVPAGGIGKAAGFADGGGATIGKLMLAAATQNARKWDEPNEFERGRIDGSGGSMFWSVLFPCLQISR